MRYTLEQLKAMSDGQLYSTWLSGAFPFDHAVGCGNCMTQHGYWGYKNMCSHDELKKQAIAIEKMFSDVMWNRHEDAMKRFRQVLEPLYALRLFYDSLYPQPAEPPAETPPASGVGCTAAEVAR